MAQQVVPASGQASCTSCQHVTEQKEVFDGILKYLRQIDFSLKKAYPMEKTEEKSVNTGVDASKRERFLAHVRVCDTKEMISMLDEEPRLMLETSTWRTTTSTVFQLAVILNSEELIRKMFSCKKGESLREQLVDTFKWGRVTSDFEVSTLDVARLMGNERRRRGLGANWDFDWVLEKLQTSFHKPFMKEKELVDVRASLLRIFNAWEDWDQARHNAWGKFCRRAWWGEPYGISLPFHEDMLFILHRYAGYGSSEDKLEKVVHQLCQELGSKCVAALLRLTDHDGQTPVHLLFQKYNSYAFQSDFWGMVKECCHENFNIFDVRDSSGRTCLHVAAAKGETDKIRRMAKLDKDGFKRILDVGCGQNDNTTALHLAVIHNQNESTKILVEHGCNINIPWKCDHMVTERESNFGVGTVIHGRALQLAAAKGHVSILQTLLKDKRLWDMGLVAGPIDPGDSSQPRHDYPALHLAASSGNPLAVKTLLDSGKFDVFALDWDGDTALHFVASCELKQIDTGACDFVDSWQYYNFTKRSHKPEAEQWNTSLGGIIGCMDLLMQAGLDMDQQNRYGETPQLRASAPDELMRWWYDKVARQNQEAKSNLVAVANAVSVTAALVATASFVGPLQPPLGLSSSADAWLTGYSQVNHTAVQVFLFCDSLSFYLAIASIMLAVIPSFTIPKEGLPMEVHIARRVVQVAVVLLFASITFVICAFSAASIAVVPESHWHYKALAVATTIVGALICSMALCLFLLRLMRLIRPDAKWVRSLTSCVFFPSEKDTNKLKQSRSHSERASNKLVCLSHLLGSFNPYFNSFRERLSKLF